jgi:Na+-driven multidrug efflux pump
MAAEEVGRWSLADGRSEHLFELALRSEHIREKSLSFLRIRNWGLPFLYIYQMRNALLGGTNQSRYLIFGAVAETLTNIFFDYGLIYGHFGLPELGFNGAAYASIIAEFAGMLDFRMGILDLNTDPVVVCYEKWKVEREENLIGCQPSAFSEC